MWRAAASLLAAARSQPQLHGGARTRACMTPTAMMTPTTTMMARVHDADGDDDEDGDDDANTDDDTSATVYTI